MNTLADTLMILAETALNTMQQYWQEYIILLLSLLA